MRMEDAPKPGMKAPEPYRKQPAPEPEPRPQRCENCYFWDPNFDGTPAGASPSSGHCRRFPPIGSEGWPEPYKDQWCGEWQPKPGVEIWGAREIRRPNPFRKETWNTQEQMRLKRLDPQLAAQLEAVTKAQEDPPADVDGGGAKPNVDIVKFYDCEIDGQKFRFAGNCITGAEIRNLLPEDKRKYTIMQITETCQDDRIITADDMIELPAKLYTLPPATNG